MKKLLFLIAALTLAVGAIAKTQPNVLWVLTDDHRYDSIRAFNKMLPARK